MLLASLAEVDEYGRWAEREGATGLMARGLSGVYRPGERSEGDFRIHWQKTLKMAIIRAGYGTGKRRDLLARYGLALRNGDDLVLVGWAFAGLSLKDARQLSDHLQNLVLKETDEVFLVRPQVVLTVKVARARPEQENKLHHASIVGVQYEPLPGQVDELGRLDELCQI
jgi:ATP-dependent DNA ligase